MPAYTYRCTVHGDFFVEAPMAETIPFENCVTCRAASPKVLGSALQFTHGRTQFHDGPMEDGNTLRETSSAWRDEFKSRHGYDAELRG